MRTNIVLDDELVEEAFVMRRSRPGASWLTWPCENSSRIAAGAMCASCAANVKIRRDYDHKNLRTEVK